MLPIPHVLISLLNLLEPEHFLINHWLDSIRIDRSIHRLKLQSASHKHTPDRADVIQALQETGLILCHSTEEADDGNDTLRLDCFQALLHRGRPADFEDVVNSGAIRREPLRGGTPLGIALVVDDMVGTELLERLRFRVGAGSGDDAGAGCFGKL